MHKLILSIIAVAFLQIGFITYVTTNQTADNARLTGTRTQPVSLFSNAVDPLDLQSIEVASLDEDPFFRRETANIRRSPSSRAVRTEFSVSGKSRRTVRRSRVQPEPFVPEQVIITYAVHKPYKFADREPYRQISAYSEPVVNKSENVEPTIAKSQKSDGNPVLNVIKKPFGWIKTLGSKLK